MTAERASRALHVGLVLLAGCTCATSHEVDAASDADTDGPIDASEPFDAPFDANESVDADAERDADDAHDALPDAGACAPGETRTCSTICGSEGTETCGAGATWLGTCAPPLELCGGGIDEDCDGEADPPLVPIDRAVALGAEGMFTGLRLVATGPDTYAIAWSEHVEEFEVGDRIVVATLSPADATLVRHRESFGIAASFTLTSLTWNGRALAAAWVRADAGEGHVFTYVPADGTNGSVSLGAATSVLLAGSATGFGALLDVPVSPSRELRFAHIDDDGTMGPSTALLSGVPARGVALGWSGTEHAAVVRDAGDTGIDLARISAAGTMLGALARIDDGTTPVGAGSIAWTGSAYAIAWEDRRHGSGEVYLTRFAPDATELAPDVRLTTDAATSQRPHVLWNGTEHLVVWEDSRGGSADAYYTLVSSVGDEVGDDRRLRLVPPLLGTFAVGLRGTRVGVAWTAAGVTPGRLQVYFAEYARCP